MCLPCTSHCHTFKRESLIHVSRVKVLALRPCAPVQHPFASTFPSQLAFSPHSPSPTPSKDVGQSLSRICPAS